MTPNELAEIKEMTGLSAPNQRDIEKEWGDKQLTNKPKIDNPRPEMIETVSPGHNTETAEDIANRLNTLLRTPGTQPKANTIKHEEDKELENLAIKLNSMLGSNNFKVERL